MILVVLPAHLAVTFAFTMPFTVTTSLAPWAHFWSRGCDLCVVRHSQSLGCGGGSDTGRVNSDRDQGWL